VSLWDANDYDYDYDCERNFNNNNLANGSKILANTGIIDYEMLPMG
jgi:hypothetical protein